MDSCFPHLAILKSRNAGKSMMKDRLDDGRAANAAESMRMRARSPAPPGKNDVFQDLDLYYVRQIARNSKVGPIHARTFACARKVADRIAR